MEIKPLHDFLVIEEIIDKVPEVNGVAFIVPDSVDRDPTKRATVLEVGPGVQQVIKGDTVLVRYHLFDDVTLDKKVYKIGREEDVFAVLK